MSALSRSLVDNTDIQSLNKLAVENFKEYLRIPTVQPNVNYETCVKLLQKLAKSLDLPIKVLNLKPNKPFVIITWTGKQPSLPSILLTSHMDVVPAFQESWIHKPFAAEEKDGKIFARGAQDAKSFGIQYLEAIRRLKLKGVSFIRTIHVSFTPDEEIGGGDGMGAFVRTDDFKKLNLGFSIDEGARSPNEKYIVVNGERCFRGFVMHCPGKSGHGSTLFKNTAGEKVAKLLRKIYEFREGEEKKLVNDNTLSLGDVTSLNVTILEGGVLNNMVPPEFTVTVDCRLSPTLDTSTWEKTLNQWCKEAGSDVHFTKNWAEPQISPTKLDASNPYWVAFKEACDDIGLKLKVEICPGATDSRNIRGLGIPAIGFCPSNNTPDLMHSNDEYVRISDFLNGIDIYTTILSKVANLEENTGTGYQRSEP